jgi:hypothetical protein
VKTLLKRIFLDNWQRKGISILLAIVIWVVVNHSLTTSKTVSRIPIRIINIPPGKTIEGLHSNGLLNKRITLTLVGSKPVLDDLSSNDLEVVIDAADKPDEFIASITKKNLTSLNPDIDVSKGINRVSHASFIIRLTKLVTEKIPIIISQPIGEPPRDYQYLDVWPYQLTLTINGPESVIKRLKARGQKLTFNLNDISKAQLDSLPSRSNGADGDVVSFFVPDAWKQVNLPVISDAPIQIDDPQAKQLRIDFVRCTLIPLESPLPAALFFPPATSRDFSPETCAILPSSLVKVVNGVPMITKPLYVKGVSRLFLQVVKEMLQIVVIPSSTHAFAWSVQFINPRVLEDRYVATLMSDVSDDELKELLPSLREEYLRNRFRSFMNRFQLYDEEDMRFDPVIRAVDGGICLEEADDHDS